MAPGIDPDLELGLRNASSVSTATASYAVKNTPSTTCSRRGQALLTRCSQTLLRLFHPSTAPVVKQRPQVEDYPNGYPRFSELIASHDSFLVARRFSNLRARLLLLKQNRLVVLERKLHRIDKEEDTPLFLGSSESDGNIGRASTLSEIDEALENYDNFIVRNNRISGLEEAEPRAVANLQNWIDGTGCIARAESAFLYRPPEELLQVHSRDESSMIGLESIVAENLLRLRDCFFHGHRPSNSRDDNVYIPSRSSTSRIARGLMIPIIVLLLLGPVVLCSQLSTLSSRLSVIAGATVIFIGIMCSSTKIKSSELVIAGTTYATVLVVFLSDLP